MRTIEADKIIAAVNDKLIEINTTVPQDLRRALARLRVKAQGPGSLAMDDIMENAEIAQLRSVPLCQDTGIVVFFVELGIEARLTEPIADVLNRAVAETYTVEGYRPSVVTDPLSRENSLNNTPAVVHMEHVPGDGLEIDILVKGFGSENMSGIKMLRPADGYEGVASFVVDTVAAAGGNPCPPIIVGVGVGGTFEQAPLLAKRALLRCIDSANSDPVWASREADMLERINALDIGPAGLGGGQTALAVHVIAAPTHIAGLPVAVNISCHASRHGRIML